MPIKDLLKTIILVCKFLKSKDALLVYVQTTFSLEKLTLLVISSRFIETTKI